MTLTSLGMTDFAFCDFSRDEGEQGGEQGGEEEGIVDESFAITHISGLDLLIEPVLNKRLKPRDLAVLLFILRFYNVRAGRCFVTIAHLSKVTGISDSMIRTSMATLKKELLLTTHVDRRTGAKSFMINPYVFSSGSRSKRALLIKTFVGLVNN